jgi:hypothetical protein
MQKKFLKLTLLLTFGIFVSAIWTNVATYAQTPNTVVPPPSSPLSKLHAVKITSPAKGQQVPIGKDLGISGTSIGNATSHCQVSVIVNGIKPYQSATGTGTSSSSGGGGGGTDYSSWNFTLSPKYTTIKEGPNNKITAKYTCSDNPSAISYYSVNVTGVAGGGRGAAANSATVIKQQMPITTIGNNTAGRNSTVKEIPPMSNSSKLMYLGIPPSSTGQSTSKLSSHHIRIGNSGSIGSTGQSSDSSNSHSTSRSEFNPFIFPFGP